jgi:hypothetical protein
MSIANLRAHFTREVRLASQTPFPEGRLPANNRVTIALKIAASTLRLSDTYLERSSVDSEPG